MENKPRRPYGRRSTDENRPDRPKTRRSYGKSEDSPKPRRTYNKQEDSPKPRRTYDKQDESPRPRRSYGRPESEDRPAPRRRYGKDEQSEKRPYRAKSYGERPQKDYGGRPKKDFSERPRKQATKKQAAAEESGLVRLNKFIANSGICSRREADTYIETGERNPHQRREEGLSGDEQTQGFRYHDGRSPRRAHGDGPHFQEPLPGARVPRRTA